MRDLLQEIWESLRRNKMRTCLTGLAVAWGIFMLIVLLGAGNGLLNAFLNDGDSFASNTMMVGGGVTSKPYDGLKQGRRIRITDKDIDILRQPRFADKVDLVSTSLSRSGYTMTYGRRYFNNVSLNGTLPGDVEMNRVQMLAGRFINDRDITEKRKVIIITHLHAKNFLSGDTDYDKLLGQRVKVGNLSFTIVGVRHAEENRDDRSLYVPYTAVKAIFGLGDEVDDITFSFHGLTTEAESDAFENQVRTAFATAHRAAPDDRRAIWVWNRFSQNLQMEKAKGILITALWIIHAGERCRGREQHHAHHGERAYARVRDPQGAGRPSGQHPEAHRHRERPDHGLFRLHRHVAGYGGLPDPGRDGRTVESRNVRTEHQDARQSDGRHRNGIGRHDRPDHSRNAGGHLPGQSGRPRQTH